MLPHSSQSTLSSNISADRYAEIVAALEQANGNISVASMYLSMPTSQLKLLLSNDLNLYKIFTDFAKIDLVTSLTDLVHLTYLEISQRLSEIPPDQLIKSHSLLIERLLDATDGRFKPNISQPTTIINNNNSSNPSFQIEAILKALPPNIRDAVLTAITDQQDDYQDPLSVSVIEGEFAPTSDDNDDLP